MASRYATRRDLIDSINRGERNISVEMRRQVIIFACWTNSQKVMKEGWIILIVFSALLALVEGYSNLPCARVFSRKRQNIVVTCGVTDGPGRQGSGRQGSIAGRQVENAHVCGIFIRFCAAQPNTSLRSWCALAKRVNIHPTLMGANIFVQKTGLPGLGGSMGQGSCRRQTGFRLRCRGFEEADAI